MGRRKTKSSPGPYLLEAELLPERIAAPDQLPYCLPAIRNLGTLVFHPKVTFLVGENGSGKSTLLEAIAIGIGLESGGLQPEFQLRDKGVAFAAG
ncbi:MAG: AAA family ATPase [Gemmataceae bacterium]|nr:AAA family ATPase [Gemmataceae bacterium]